MDTRRKTYIALGLLMHAICLQPAAAGTVDSCSPTGDPVARLSACTAVIAGTYSAAEKARAFRIRGNLRLSAGAADEAIQDFNSAIAIEPKQAAAFAGRAQALLLKQKASEAVSDLNTAVGLVPNSPVYLNARGYANLLLEQPNLAIADFSEAIRLDPGAVSPRNNRGLARMKLNQPDAAIEDYSVAVGMNPLYALAYNNRGYAYEAKGLKAEAIADFRRALEIDATLSGARNGLERLGAIGVSGTETDHMIAEGRNLALQNCASCHATGATGLSPNVKAPAFHTIATRHPILTLREPLTRSIAAPHDDMPNFHLPQSDVDKIIAYIDSLSSTRD